MKGLLTRVSTAIIFVLVMLGGLYGGRYTFVMLFALITAFCLWEFLGIVLSKQSKSDRIRLTLGIIIGLTPFLLISALQLELVKQTEDYIAYSTFLFFPLLFTAFIYELYTKSEKPFANVAYMILGLVYIGVPFALLDLIAFDGYYFYANTVFGLLLLTWCNDTAAYFVGSQLGKTPLFPRISPKKTWEGTLGGITITFILAYVLSLVFTELRLIDWMILAAIVSIFGSLGDLVESMLKRSVQVKDSGSLLPGHGGFLDRFDGFIFLLPFAAAYLLLIR
jgi:phosphatidate cytidylyltransferase